MLQAQSQGFVTTLLLLFGCTAPRPARAANTPISSVLGRGPSQCHSSYWGTHRVFGMAAVSMQKLQLPAMVTLCVGVCPTSRCVHGTTNPPFCDGGPQTRFFLPSFLEETAKKACPRFTRPGERHCWVFDQSGNHSGSDWLLENFKWGPSLFCFLIVKISLLRWWSAWLRHFTGMIWSASKHKVNTR